MRTLVFFSLAAFSCLAQTPPSTPKPAAPKPVAPKPVAPKPVAPKPTPTPKPEETREPGLYGTMETTMGTLKFVLYEKIAPISVKNFCDLVLGRKQWFDEKTNGMVRRPLIPGTTFHRVIPGFMIQAGDPTGTGSGNVGFTVPDEFNPDYKFDKPGRFGMANVSRPNTNSSQFFITEAPTPWLDGKHTVFGQLTDNQELVNKIARVPVGENNKPVTPVKIVKVTFERVGPVPPNAPEGGPPAKKYVPPVKKAVPTTTPAAAPTKKPAAPAAAPPAKK